MNERWQQVEQLFNSVVDLAAPDRAAVLAKHDPELRAEVEDLLANIGGAGTLLGRAVAAERKAIGPERIGPYRLVELIGRGGMGAVYRAERDDSSFRQTVAVKLLHHSLGSEAAVARFRDERQILASLEHPGIVRLLDGGQTDAQLPYLVMEHVTGSPITEAARGWSIRARVEAIRSVCASVQYAHNKLVIHRDLKPSNILVDERGRTKLLDFGIAKLLDPSAKREAETGTGMALFTPAYASPEQVRGEPVAVATDVYSLGAVLYELLTDKPPLDLPSNVLEQLLVVAEQDVSRASSRADDPARKRELAGDLDIILAKALHKDPEQRYSSIAELADDLGRYLDGHPVHARPSTLSYRVGKLVRRHRGKLAIATLVTAALATATVVSISESRNAKRQAALAEQQLADVRALSNAMLFELDDQLRHIAGATDMRRAMVTRALAYLDKVTTELDDDPAVARELAAGYVRIGDLQGNYFETNLGNIPDGLTSYRKAQDIVGRLPDEAATRKLRTTIALGTGMLKMFGGDHAAAKALLVPALAAHPGDREYDRYVMRGHLALVWMAHESGDDAAAESWNDRLLGVVDGWSPTPDTRYARGVALDERGLSLAAAGDADGACREFGKANVEFERLVKEAPDDARFIRELGFSSLALAGCHGGIMVADIWMAHVGDVATAERLASRGVELLSRLATDRADTGVVSFAIASRITLGSIVAQRDQARAAALFDTAIADYEKLPSAFRDTDSDAWWFYCPVVETYVRAGRRADAERYAQLGLAAADRIAAGADLGGKLRRAQCRYLVARGKVAAGDAAAARALTAQITTDLISVRAGRARGISGYLGAVRALQLETACGDREAARAIWQAWPGTRPAFIDHELAALEACK